MKSKKLIPGVVIVFLLSAFTFYDAISWKQKEGYTILWQKTSFKGLKASISFDEENPEKSKISAFIDPRTISTGNRLKDDHAKDALEVDKYPAITFISTSVKSLGHSKYEAIGKLTLKNVTKEIRLPFSFYSKKDLNDKFPFIPAKTFVGVITIIPKEFNITRMGTPDEVVVNITVPVTA